MAVTALNSTGGPLERRKSWLELQLGPDNYRIVRGLARNPLSVTGMILIGIFFLVAFLAPVLAPPTALGRDDTSLGWLPSSIAQIPRDGSAISRARR
jgi:hypothetical protein